MRQWILLLTLCALPAIAVAQDSTPDEDTPFFEGFDDLAEGMRKLFEEFSNDVTPMLDDLAQQLRGLNGYHPPEMLPNGDIIIRRKTAPEPPEDAPAAPQADENGAIDI
jgi:hypothetical protein